MAFWTNQNQEDIILKIIRTNGISPMAVGVIGMHWRNLRLKSLFLMGNNFSAQERIAFSSLLNAFLKLISYT